MSSPAQTPDFGELVRKVDAIYTALFGLQGQPGTGRIGTLEASDKDQGERIAALERWQWKMIGAAGVAVLFIEIIRAFR